MMQLVVDGVPYTNFTSLTVSQSIEEFVGEFTFEATDVEGTFGRDNYPVKLGSFCQVIIDDIPVLTGFVEVVDVQSSPDSHTVSISGRDVNCDLVDSTVPPEISFSAQTISLENFINTIQGTLGLKLPVINEVIDLSDFTGAEIISPAAGEGCFEFLETRARKKGVLLTKDGNGAIVITRGTGSALGKSFFNLLNDGAAGNNNILSSRVSYDYSDRFRTYTAGSQADTQALISFGTDLDNESITDANATATDEGMPRDTRLLYIVAEGTTDSAELKDRAQWEANIRKTRARMYSCMVEGHTVKAGVPYWFNKTAMVQDDPMAVSEEMLVKSVTFSESVAGGETTELEFVPKDSYTLELAEPQSQKDTNSVASPFDLSAFLPASSINEKVNQNITESASEVIDSQ